MRRETLNTDLAEILRLTVPPACVLCGLSINSREPIIQANKNTVHNTVQEMIQQKFDTKQKYIKVV